MVAAATAAVAEVDITIASTIATEATAAAAPGDCGDSGRRQPYDRPFTLPSGFAQAPDSGQYTTTMPVDSAAVATQTVWLRL